MLRYALCLAAFALLAGSGMAAATAGMRITAVAQRPDTLPACAIPGACYALAGSTALPNRFARGET